MVTYSLRLIRLVVGLFVFTLGLVLSINADLGMSAWNCLNSGIINYLPITFGQANIMVAVILVAVSYLSKQKIGLGTIGNMALVGTYMDLIERFELVPKAQAIYIGIPMILCGLLVSAVGVYLYLGAGFGAGPRDGVMLTLMKITGKPLAQCRMGIEITVLIVAVLLGGFFGIGTLISAFFNGPIMQGFFKLIGFKPKEVEHEYLGDTFKKLCGR